MKKLILLFAILFATTSFSQEVFTTKVKMKQTPNLSVPDSIVTKDGNQILRTTSVADFSALIAQPTPSLQDVTTVGATTTTTIQSIGFHAVPSSGFNGSFLLPENLRVFDNANDFIDLSMVLTYPTAIFGKDGFESSLSTIDLTADRNINLPNNNGTLILDADLLNYVTLATAQTITGEKTFDANVKIVNSSISIEDGGSESVYMNSNTVSVQRAGSILALEDDRIKNFRSLDTFELLFPPLGNDVSQIFQAKDGTVALLGDIPDVSQTNLSYGESYINKYKDRVVADGATYFPNDGGYDYANMREIGIDQDMSLMLTPSAVKAGTLYNVKPQALDFTVVRAGTNATYIDEDGVRQTALANVPRINYIDGEPSILTEPATTNLYTTPDVLTTQNVTTTATSYTVSFEGTGTITFSGTHTGSLVGTGANDRVEITFTPTAGTLTSTVTGSVIFGQIEALSYQTSYVIGTRNADQITGAGDVTTFNSEEGTFVIEISALSNDLTNRTVSISDGTGSNTMTLRYDNISSRIIFLFVVGGVTQANINITSLDITDFNKIALTWKLNEFKMFVGGVQIGSTDTSGTVPPINTFNVLNLTSGTGSDSFHGNTKSIKVFKTALTDAELARLTKLNIPFILLAFRRKKKQEFKQVA